MGRRTPPSREELKALCSACRTPRGKSVSLSLVNAFALSEWIDFANNWWKYKADIEAATVPLKVDIPYRSKTLTKIRDSFVYLWDDSTEALKELLEERKRELGET